MLIPGHLFKRLFPKRRKDHVPEFAKSVKKGPAASAGYASLSVRPTLQCFLESGAAAELGLVGLETGAGFCHGVAMFMVYCSVSAGSVTDRLSSAVPDDGRNFPPLFIC